MTVFCLHVQLHHLQCCFRASFTIASSSSSSSSACFFLNNGEIFKVFRSLLSKKMSTHVPFATPLWPFPHQFSPEVICYLNSVPVNEPPYTVLKIFSSTAQMRSIILLCIAAVASAAIHHRNPLMPLSFFGRPTGGFLHAGFSVLYD